MKFHTDGDPPQPGQVFVFGSNLAGIHGAGAALAARRFYGAIQGIGMGKQGNSFAIPTKDTRIITLPLNDIYKYVNTFKAFAQRNPFLDFFVTRVGCGLAGYKDFQIAPMFKNSPDNCSFPEAWQDHLTK